MLRYLLLLTIAIISLNCNDEAPLYLSNDNQTGVTQEQLINASSNKSSYAIGEQISLTINNGSDSIMYIPTCARLISYYIQMKIKGSWQDTGANGLPCTGYTQFGIITLLPGRAYHYTDAIVHYGHYRMRYPVTLGSSNSITWLYTNEFLVGQE